MELVDDPGSTGVEHQSGRADQRYVDKIVDWMQFNFTPRECGHTVNWPIVLATVGSVTGVGGLCWQLINYRLTGGRIRIFAIYSGEQNDAQVRVSVANVGRLDVSIAGYTVWADIPGRRIQRVRSRIEEVRRAGIRHLAHARLTTFSPCVHFFPSSDSVGGEADSTTLPVILKSGSAVNLPDVEIRWGSQVRRKLRVAIHLASGKVLKAYPVSVDAFRPVVIDREDFERGTIVKNSKFNSNLIQY